MADQQIAVLIDYENVGPGAIQWILDQISDSGRVIVKRAYGHWSSNSVQLAQLLELGIEPVQLFRTTRGGKNSSDMRLVIDAIELLYQSPVDTFVIVSSDSDFVPLTRKLRSAGKTVIGAGRQAAVSRALVTSCDRYFYLSDGMPGNPSPRTVYGEPVKGNTLLLRAVRATMDEQGKTLGTKVHQTMQRLDPAFDFRALGHATFSRYLETSSEVSVTRPQGPGDIIVELFDQPTSRSNKNGNDDWAQAVDAVWRERAERLGDSLSGTTAAALAARTLGSPNLRSTQYRTLHGLIQASYSLQQNWAREGNKIVLRTK